MLLVLHLLFQLLELLMPKLSSLSLTLGCGAFPPFSLGLTSSAGFSDCSLLVLQEVLPLIVSVPAVLPLVRISNVQGGNPHLHTCHVHTCLHKVFVKGDTLGKVHAETLIQDDSGPNRI
jgi:hypothetical protein